MDNSELIKLEKRNFKLRIAMIALLLLILAFVIYFRYGYTDPDDVGVVDIIGRNVSCSEALIYYAENEWGYRYEQNNDIKSVPFP